ncbi:V4R domain-containing protein [Aphanothece sacrum]|uniref:4-vinyl reductase 4VR n=1 Tax=Aphanothece sacrum FPU1 TaxID=1920663 RepID=A0A401IM19_APHSA|nr:V4R domain-containing protein [Aphanothece sacrum]GBF82304.1 4-vinyl reductase 4VR [Aphanothece sacrum FPU1]GBF84204.1 4-vinyl reductase 4VR [Aphanothece sacrum FPU3]
MIDIANLIQDNPVKGNYFSPDAYVQGDFEFGLLENRSGSRLLALPETLLQALYAALENELGQGSGVALFSCGLWWGKSFYRRFAEEVGKYYGKPLASMEMIEFLQCLKQCWKTHGWGTLEIDFKYYQQGFLLAKIINSPFAQFAPQNKRPMCFFEAGILSAFLSEITEEKLHCIQTSCESMGADCNDFVIGIAERINPASAWLEEGHDHGTIMELLCRNQSIIN